KIFRMHLPAIRPMVLSRLPGPFSDPDWLFEVKHDGFRALCYVAAQSVKLVSRRDHVYKSFTTLCDSIAADLHRAWPLVGRKVAKERILTDIIAHLRWELN